MEVSRAEGVTEGSLAGLKPHACYAVAQSKRTWGDVDSGGWRQAPVMDHKTLYSG
jgi:hypothetical protein